MAKVDNIYLQKQYGQHFLTDGHIIDKIVVELQKIPEDIPVLEIGPGAGVLTQHLIHRSKYKAIEIDARWAAYLSEKYPQKKQQIVCLDILKADWDFFLGEEYVVVGNFPYNISSQILFRMLDHKEKVLGLIGMFQKEVAQRVCAQHGNKQYGILSVLLQARYDTSLLFDVSPHAFRPNPKVYSAVIHLNRRKNIHLDCDESLFDRVVKQAFNQRRKTLRNSIKTMLVNEETKQLAVLDKRPEQLDVNAFINLTNIIDAQR